jgi:hypothetical protein
MGLLNSFLQSSPGTLLRVTMTFFAFAFALVIFRAPNFTIVGQVFHRLFVPTSGAGSPVPAVVFWTLALIVLLAHLIALRPGFFAIWNRVPAPVRGVALASFLFVTLILPPETQVQFIYFQF